MALQAAWDMSYSLPKESLAFVPAYCVKHGAQVCSAVLVYIEELVCIEDGNMPMI